MLLVEFLAEFLCQATSSYVLPVLVYVWNHMVPSWVPTYIVVIVVAAVATAVVSRVMSMTLRAKPHMRAIPPSPLHPSMQLSAVRLGQELEKGTFTSKEVTEAYISHIQRVNPRINAMVFEMFDEAREQAAEADRKWAAWRNGSSKKKPHWLCGVPCTIKESFYVKGCPNAAGHPYRQHIYSTEDAPPVARLRAAGCVFLGVTNTSEMCMWMESNNRVYGITCNPYDTRCLVGGSSGGEGAATAAVFGAFGLGADVGGSIRMPAFFNGVFGFKPSSHRVPNLGQTPGARASIHHLLGTGPLCRFAEDMLPLTLVMAEGGFLEDPEQFPPPPPLPKNNRECLEVLTGKRTKPLRVIAITDFGWFGVPVCQSQIDAVERVAQHLTLLYGAQLTVYNLRDAQKSTISKDQYPRHIKLFSRAMQMWSTAMTHDENEKSFLEYMSEGNPEGTIRPFHEFWKWLQGRSVHTAMSIGLCMIEAIELFLAVNKRKEKNLKDAEAFRQGLQDALGEDGILVCPTYPKPAPKHHEPTWRPFQWLYTGVFNVTRMPIVSMPMWTPDLSAKNRTLSAEDARRAGREESYHVPKGVQLVGAWGNDALVLAAAMALEKDRVGGYKYPSWTEGHEAAEEE